MANFKKVLPTPRMFVTIALVAVVTSLFIVPFVARWIARLRGTGNA